MSFLPPSGHAGAPRPKTVLILDADPAARATIRATLGKSGFVTIAAANAEDAAVLCTDATVDLAIVDDSEDGRAAIDWLRAREADGKVLLLTHATRAAHPEAVAEAAPHSGADRALSRPFTLSYLVHVVHEMVTPFKPSVVLAADARIAPIAP